MGFNMQNVFLEKCTWLLIIILVLTVPLVAQNSLDFIPVWVRVGDRTAAVDKERDTASIESAEFSPDGALIASGAKRGGDVRLWNLDGEELWQRFHENEPDDEVEVISWTRDSKYVFSGGEDFRVRVWRVADGELVRTLDHIASVDGMRTSNKGDILATGDEAGQITLWDISDADPAKWPEEPIAVIIQGPDENRPDGGSGHSDVNSIDWTKDDRFIITAGRNAVVKRWEIARVHDDDQGLTQVYEGFWDSIKSNRLSPDEKYVAAGGQRSPQSKVIVWDYETAEPVKIIEVTSSYKMEAVEFTPDGKFLITGGVEGKGSGGIGNIRVYNVEMGFALVHMEEVFRQEYFDFNNDGSLMVSSHEDGTARLWEVEYKSIPINVFETVESQSDAGVNVEILKEDAKLYSDNIFKIAALPDYLNEQWYVQTSIMDQASRADSLIRIDLKTESTLYVAYDPRAEQLPAWLQDWSPVNDSLTIKPDLRPSGVGHLDLYSKVCDGTVVLGGNLAEPARGAAMNYIVIGREGVHYPAAVQFAPESPETVSLLQNYPNPFNPTTTIEYRLASISHVKVQVYDVTGRWIAVLVDTEQNAGVQQVQVSGRNWPSGVYFYQLEVLSDQQTFSQTRKMMLVK